MASRVVHPRQEQIGDREGPRDECGVFGMYAPDEDVVRLARTALAALQHRGQESAGIATSHAGHLRRVCDVGLVHQVFGDSVVRDWPADLAIGHVRYSTCGTDPRRDAQPLQCSGPRPIMLAHNGNLINATRLRAELGDAGTDSELIAILLAMQSAPRIEDAVQEVMSRLQGAYAVVAIMDGRLVAFRDPLGIRPLVLGRLGRRFCVASETCALDAIGARFLRDVEPGEIITVGGEGITTRRPSSPPLRTLCVFENIYFASPDSRMDGRLLRSTRATMGRLLAREAPAQADVVIAVPESGIAAAQGFARVSSLPCEAGLLRLPAVGRSFIQPGQARRSAAVRQKFHAVPQVVAGKRVAVVDDSLVRGTTLSWIVELLRGAGAAEVHLRICSPPLRHPCRYGIDLPTRREMVTHGRTSAEVAAHLGADSLAHLSMGALYEAIGSPLGHCDGCFTGHYPLPSTPAPAACLADS